MNRGDIVNAVKAARRAKQLDEAVDIIITRIVQVAQRDAADFHAKQAKEEIDRHSKEMARGAYASLASAMKKVLPPALLAQVIDHLDPVGAFVKTLREEGERG